METIISLYGENLTAKNYITNPAIARETEIKKSIVVLLTPEKSALLIGKPGIGKTAIVEGIAYLIQRNLVPDALKGYSIVRLQSNSLITKIKTEETEELVISRLVRELKNYTKVILFIDEIHTLIGSKSDGPMDLANILKPVLDRGDIKLIGATTTEEYQTYILKDRAFLRRFDRIDVMEPDEETTVKILMGTIPKIEKQTGVKFKYNDYVVNRLMGAVVSATSEFKRVYGISAMYPDVALSVLTQAFSLALFDNKKEVSIIDIYNAIKTSKRIYPDSIVKELNIFKESFKDVLLLENIELPDITLKDVEKVGDLFL